MSRRSMRLGEADLRQPRNSVVGSLIVAAVGLTVVARPAGADEGAEFFEKRIRPALVKYCYECHSAAAAEVKGGLRLDSRDGMRTGGDSGPAVVPGNVGESLLIDAVRRESFEMPPDKKLPDAVIADLTRWIEMGAPDPRDRPPTPAEAADLSWQATLEARRDWWSLQPVHAPVVPNVENTEWSNRAIDRFVLAKLDDAGQAPAETADPRTLIRRLSLMLIGLPPDPSEVEAFVADYAESPETAYESLVNRLLDSPHFGECWARRWMDVVRFTETHGNEWNYEVHHAWRYRDYLIRALNGDVPYDQLVREHIAGDLLEPPRWNEQENFNESVIGTAFYRFGEVNHDDCIGLRKIGYDIVDNQIDTLSKAFQATTIACARCHDHKIDAVSMRDYYALLGILRSSRLVAHTVDSPAVNAKPIRRLRELKSRIHERLAERWRDEARDVASYLLAGDAARRGSPHAAELAAGLNPGRLQKWVAALNVDKPSMDHPLSPWLSLTTGADDANSIAGTWRQLDDRYAAEQSARQRFDEESFFTFGEFRNGEVGAWQAAGHGLRGGATKSGEFCVAHEGDRVVAAVFPAGCLTHTLSQKLNGTLRSPVLTKQCKHISFQVLGGHTSALRLVSNNCQLNYANYRVLTSDKLGWVTFSPPEDLDSLRVYAELMTKFDNPKFPDQLGTLGGDTKNDRVPWEQAAADPRSFFGVTRVVLHDCDETPKPDLGHLCALFDQDRSEHVQATAPTTLADAAERYAAVIQGAIHAWSEGQADDADTRWLSWLIDNNLLDNSLQKMPQLANLVARYREIEDHELVQPRIIPGMADFGAGFDQPVLIGGDCMNPGDPVPRRYLEMLPGSQEQFRSQGSGRLELAERIASPQNPVTARVMVNRIWHHLFGTGIVRSVDNFGRVGELPSHPELLDHLAVRFVEQNWSIKRLIHDIVLTRTFRMSNMAAPAAKEIDPQNRLLQHYPARRMDAETIRDTILTTSGCLDPTLFGMSIPPYRETANADRRLFPGPLDGDGRRSVYIKASLMERPRFLSAFNLPGGKVAQGRRDVTNVPTQALALLNDPFVVQQAGRWADRLVEQSSDSIASRIQSMFQQALSRPPTADESEDFTQFVLRLAELHGVESENILGERLIWTDVAHLIFNLKEFIYIP